MLASCLKTIKDHYDSLSYSEKLVANYSLDNASYLVDLSIQQLAEIVGVAPSTIINFVKKLGFSGYRQFKIGLASEIINTTQQNWNNPITETTENLYVHVGKINIRSIEESFDYIKYDKIVEASSMIVKASKVAFFGVGSSLMLAHEAYDLCLRLGINCTINSDIHHQMLSASLLRETDIAFIISQSGINKTSIQFAEKASNGGAKTIGICNYAKTPFSKLVDIALTPFDHISEYHPGHYVFKIPILCIIETLYYHLATQLGETSNKAIAASENIVKNTAL